MMMNSKMTKKIKKMKNKQITLEKSKKICYYKK